MVWQASVPDASPRSTSRARRARLLGAPRADVCNVEWVAKAVREAEAVTDQEALELGVIDLVAQNRSELLESIDGRVVDDK